MGSIKVLTDVLGAGGLPEVFGRSMRIAHCVQHMHDQVAPAFAVVYGSCRQPLSTGVHHPRI